jgi:hypothetical protein
MTDRRWCRPVAAALYAVAHRMYDLARRLDRYSRGVDWRDAG